MNFTDKDWEFDKEEGTFENDRFKTISDGCFFKCKETISFGDIWTVNINKGSCKAWVGFANKECNVSSEEYDVNSMLHIHNAVWLRLGDGTVIFGENTTEKNENYHSYNLLETIILNSEPYSISLRINIESQLPEIKFNEHNDNDNDNWYEYSNLGNDRLKNDFYYPFIKVWNGDDLTNFNIITSKPTKNANKLKN